MRIDNDDLRLESLYLRNFRCFGHCEVELHPQLTVLVAENGRGKTAILDAIGIALGLFVDAVSDARQYPGFSRRDIRLVRESDVMVPVLPTEFLAKGVVAGRRLSWRGTLRGGSSRHHTSTKEALALLQAARHLHDDVERSETSGLTDKPILPLVAFYGAGRAWKDRGTTEEQRDRAAVRAGRMLGYLGCLDSSSSMGDLDFWYENTANCTRDPRFSTELTQNLSLLTAVREATRVVLEPTGWCKLDWDFDQRQLVVEHTEKGRLPLSTLSDGVRNMVALVADIARRCASLNPHLGEQVARRTPGILLIDEVDAHLHPGWQQQVVELLSRSFPGIQMVLSTHSPHVLSTVDKESIRLIRFQNGEGRLEVPRYQTRGVESADVLARIMGVDPIPHVEEARWLSHYRSLIQERRYEEKEGLALWRNLVLHFDEDHPEIEELRTLVRLSTFQRDHGVR